MANYTSEIPASRLERPILSDVDDLLERRAFIRRLSDAVVSPKTKKSTEVVIGITGPWGSGKSSILNLLSEHIASRYEDAIVVRFDPWLISGRNDLISEFFGELIETIKSKPKASERFKAILATLADYAGQLAPVASLYIPGLGAVVKGGASLLGRLLPKKSESLSALRARLAEQLAIVSIPIVVLIDELDRVEDEEIRTIAQLVRSVADLPGISYVLAYDPKRVMQALGKGFAGEESVERGRAYLEKIVQLQIPLPITFRDEIQRLLLAELASIAEEAEIPKNVHSDERFQEFLKIVLDQFMETPRDVKRLVGTFHALRGMVRGEVDWIDLLAYCVILVKLPGTARILKEKPEEFSDDILTESAFLSRSLGEKSSGEDRLDTLIPKSELSLASRSLIKFIFPHFNSSESGLDHVDALYRRRPLLTTLRLGLIPGACSRLQLDEFVAKNSAEMEVELESRNADKTLSSLLERFEGGYDRLASDALSNFWSAAESFLTKPDCVWIRLYNPMHEWITPFGEILERAVLRNEKTRDHANHVFHKMMASKEDQIVCHWVRRHVFKYGLLGRQTRTNNAWFLSESETIEATLKLTNGWRAKHMDGQFLPCRWDSAAIFLMLDAGVWDRECKTQLDNVLIDDAAVDGFVLMLFGGIYTVEQATIEKLCSYDLFLNRIKDRLKDMNVDESLLAALQKASGHW